MTSKVEIFARNLEVSDRIKDYVTKKAAKLDRFLNEIEVVRVDFDFIQSARSAKDRYVAQITVRGHKALLRTEERSDELTAAFDQTIDKMQRKMEKFKGKHYRGRGSGRSAAEATLVSEVIPSAAKGDVDESLGVISRRKTFDLFPMTEAEALEQMNLLGHDNFFIFHNIETDAINVLYRRRDDTYGLIEPKLP